MDPKHLVQLAVILDKGSITAAAKHLLLAQPTLTRNMATLEMQAGTTLFARSRFGVKATPMGEALAREGRAIMRNVELAREQASRYQIGFNEQLRVAVGPLIGLAVMPEIIERLTRSHPRMALTVTTTSPTTALTELLDDRHDVVIGPAPHDSALSGILRVLLAEDRTGIYCSSNHALASQSTLSVDDLKSADWLSVGMASTYEREILDMLTRKGVTRFRTQVVLKNDAAILFRLLAQGRHLAVLPRLPALALSGLAPLVELKLDDGQMPQRNLYLWSREEIRDTSAYTAFEQVTREVFEQVQAAGGPTGAPPPMQRKPSGKTR